MKRLEVILLLAALSSWPLAGRAQTTKIYRVDYLGTGSNNPRLLQFFLEGLGELGWVEGKNIVIGYRFAEC